MVRGRGARGVCWRCGVGVVGVVGEVGREGISGIDGGSSLIVCAILSEVSIVNVWL